MVYKLKLVKSDGYPSDFPTVKSREDAVADATLAKQLSWVERVLVFRAPNDTYGSDWLQIADIPGTDRKLPEIIPFEEDGTRSI